MIFIELQVKKMGGQNGRPEEEGGSNYIAPSGVTAIGWGTPAPLGPIPAVPGTTQGFLLSIFIFKLSL